MLEWDILILLSLIGNGYPEKVAHPHQKQSYEIFYISHTLEFAYTFNGVRFCGKSVLRSHLSCRRVAAVGANVKWVVHQTAMLSKLKVIVKARQANAFFLWTHQPSWYVPHNRVWIIVNFYPIRTVSNVGICSKNVSKLTSCQNYLRTTREH